MQTNNFAQFAFASFNFGGVTMQNLIDLFNNKPAAAAFAQSVALPDGAVSIAPDYVEDADGIARFNPAANYAPVNVSWMVESYRHGRDGVYLVAGENWKVRETIGRALWIAHNWNIFEMTDRPSDFPQIADAPAGTVFAFVNKANAADRKIVRVRQFTDEHGNLREMADVYSIHVFQNSSVTGNGMVTRKVTIKKNNNYYGDVVRWNNEHPEFPINIQSLPSKYVLALALARGLKIVAAARRKEVARVDEDGVVMGRVTEARADWYARVTGGRAYTNGSGDEKETLGARGWIERGYQREVANSLDLHVGDFAGAKDYETE